MEGNASRAHSALSLRGMVIGVIGSALITASSLYVALKLGALPWPIVFAALASLFILKALGNTSLNEVNVAHTAMDAGAMVAGGLAFTIPGIWILGSGSDIGLLDLLVVSLSGVALGLVATACARRYFIDRERLPFPIGISAAEAMSDADAGTGGKSRALFVSLGIGAIFAYLRDGLGALPALLFKDVQIPGVSFGIYNSPMMLAVGFIVGPLMCLLWFLGGVIGNFGIVVFGTASGIWDIAAASAFKTSLGMGIMFGAGFGVVVRQLAKGARRRKAASGSPVGDEPAVSHARGKLYLSSAFVSAAVALAATLLLSLPLIPSLLMVMGVWVAVFMSSQSVGVTGINPMEVFGLMILLLISLCVHDLALTALFFIAAIVAVACGVTGDLMNDYKAGAMLGTAPRDQWVAQAIGGIVGAVVAAVVLFAMLSAYGAGAFGLTGDGTFVAAQASAIAAMVGGIPDPSAFVAGFVVALALALLDVPVMILGLGVYLPFYFSLTAAIGGLVRFVFDKIQKRRGGSADGMAVAAGLLGGESLMGVILAFVVMFSAL